ncbi:TaqI-like C-terminal specificity domain-containing protein, partial [Sphingobacterium spiritivorum]
EDFSKQKIMYSDIAERLSFCLVNDGSFCNNTVYFIVSETENLEYLLNFLNSDLIDWYYRTLSVQLGEAAVRMFSIYVLNIPIPKNVTQNVYEAYNLSEEEINFIKSKSCN